MFDKALIGSYTAVMNNNTSEHNNQPAESQTLASHRRVWNRNFSFLVGGTIAGAAGGVAAGYGLSFLVFFETGSVLLSALVLTARLVPSLIVPLTAGPLLDRLPRKPALVWGDAINGILYLVMGGWLLIQPFSYPAYLVYSMLLACASVVDELAFDSILPMVITPGEEQRSYAAASMVYPFLNIVMMPVAALILQQTGIPPLLLMQGVLSLLAAFLDSRIRLEKDLPRRTEGFNWSAWLNDLKEAGQYLKQEPGLLSFFSYAAVTNGVANSCSPVLVAWFSTAPGLSPLLYSAFSAAESIGRAIGSTSQYLRVMKPERKYGFSLMVMTVYNLMDALLLFISYPLMLVNRALVGTLGSVSYTIRASSVQTYIPNTMRARINSFQNLLFYGVTALLTVLFGWLGDILPAPWVLVIGALLNTVVLLMTWVKHRRACQKVFLAVPAAE